VVARKKKDPPMGAPEWMVTFGDMMSLLLTFFVMLLSMSEIKEDVKYQEVMDSIRTAFGYNGAIGAVPITASSQNSLVEQLKRIVIPELKKREGDSDEEGIDGRVFRVTDVREGVNVQIGGRISFERFKADLKPGAEVLIANLAAKVVGHNTIIKVRGHATREPLPEGSVYADAMELSIARARAVAGELERSGIRPERIRVVGAGSFEPVAAQAYDEQRRALNRRVEVILTEAIVDDYSGQPLPQEQREASNGP
jgi:chemotaxis protein MotB